MEVKNLTNSGVPLSKFDYTYDADGNITTWTQQSDTQTPTMYTNTYDGANQLIEASVANTSTQALLNRYDYAYDEAGNRTSEQINQSVSSSDYNGFNQLIDRRSGGPCGFPAT